MKLKTTSTFILFLLLASNLWAFENYTGLHTALLPSASYKDGEGLAAGGQIYFFQYADGAILPYKWAATLSAKMSNQGAVSSTLFFDMPNILGSNRRLFFYVEFNRTLLDNFYGLGNNPDFDPNYTDPAHANFKHENYYYFKSQRPTIRLAMQSPLPIEHMRQIFGLGYSNQKAAPYSLPNKLSEDRPIGFAGGNAAMLLYGFIYDTRDQETIPNRGVWSELLAEYASHLQGNTFDYLRLTFTDRRYVAVRPGIVYAQRIIVEPIFGNVPFYDMALINSSYVSHYGLGGAYSLRGVPRLLFVGQHKILGNFEFRFETLKTKIFKQELTFYMHTFFDAGRVWGANEALTLAAIHSSYGAGLHVRWKKDLVGALDIGRSQFSNMSIYITFRNLF